MNSPSPEDVRLWRDSRNDYFSRASERLGGALREYIADWVTLFGVRIEAPVNFRVKSAERIWQKIDRKVSAGRLNALTDLDELLVLNSPVGDLVGASIVVRSLTDVDRFRRCLSDNAFDPEGVTLCNGIDDKNVLPSVTGYRAIHLNGVISTQIRGLTREVPFEVQLKTKLQDSWGYFTHDSAYELVGIKDDPRFRRVGKLQRLLADALDVADRLNEEIELVQAHELSEIRSSPMLADELSYAGVMKLVDDLYGEPLSGADARAIEFAARSVGIVGIGDLRTVIEDRERVDAVVDSDVERIGERPKLTDVLRRIIEASQDGTTSS